MKTVRFAGWVSVVLLLLSGCASSRKSAVAQIEEMEREWVRALQNHDMATLDRILADSFGDSTYRGSTRSKQEMLSGAAAAPTYRSVRFEDLDVRIYGRDTAVVTGVNVLEGATAHDMVRVRFTDVFIRSHGRWLAVAAHETLRTDSP